MKAFWYNDERKNVCGLRIRELRQEKDLTIQRLSGIRFIPDYEVSIFAELLETTPEYLLGFGEQDEKEN